MIMILMIHNNTYRPCEHRIFFFIIWDCVSAFMMMVFIHKKYYHTTHWRFLPDNSFTRLVLLDNLSQSMESNWRPNLTSSVLLFCPPLESFLDPSFCPPFP